MGKQHRPGPWRGPGRTSCAVVGVRGPERLLRLRIGTSPRIRLAPATQKATTRIGLVAFLRACPSDDGDCSDSAHQAPERSPTNDTRSPNSDLTGEQDRPGPGRPGATDVWPIAGQRLFPERGGPDYSPETCYETHRPGRARDEAAQGQGAAGVRARSRSPRAVGRAGRCGLARTARTRSTSSTARGSRCPYGLRADAAWCAPCTPSASARSARASTTRLTRGTWRIPPVGLVGALGVTAVRAGRGGCGARRAGGVRRGWAGS